MMTEQELQQMQALRDEIATLRSEIDSLRGFVKALYSMMDEDEQYDGPEGMVGGMDFRGINT